MCGWLRIRVRISFIHISPNSGVLYMFGPATARRCFRSFFSRVALARPCGLRFASHVCTISSWLASAEARCCTCRTSRSHSVSKKMKILAKGTIPLLKRRGLSWFGGSASGRRCISKRLSSVCCFRQAILIRPPKVALAAMAMSDGGEGVGEGEGRNGRSGAISRRRYM